MAGRPQTLRLLAATLGLLAALCEGSADDGDYQCLLQVDSTLGQLPSAPPNGAGDDGTPRTWVAVHEDCSEVIKRRDAYSKQEFDKLQKEGQESCRKAVEHYTESCNKNASLQAAAHESCEQKLQTLQDGCRGKVEQLQGDLARAVEAKGQLTQARQQQEEVVLDQHQRIQELTMQLDKTTAEKNQLDKENMRIQEEAQSLRDAVKRIGELEQQLERATEETQRLEEENARLLGSVPWEEGDKFPGTVRRLLQQVRELEKKLGESRKEEALLYKDSGRLIAAKQGAEKVVERQAQQLEVGQRLRHQLEKESLESKLAGQKLEATLVRCQLEKKQVVATCELHQKQMLAQWEPIQKQMSDTISALLKEKNQSKSVAAAQIGKLQVALKNVTEDEGKLAEMLTKVGAERSAQDMKWKLALDEIITLDDRAILSATDQTTLQQAKTRLGWQLNVLVGASSAGGANETAIGDEVKRLLDMEAKLDRKLASLQGRQAPWSRDGAGNKPRRGGAGNRPGGGGPIRPGHAWRRR